MIYDTYYYQQKSREGSVLHWINIAPKQIIKLLHVIAIVCRNTNLQERGKSKQSPIEPVVVSREETEYTIMRSNIRNPFQSNTFNKPKITDPTVTISNSLTIDIDGIINNDDEVSLQTPVTIPEDHEPDEFAHAVEEALTTRIPNMEEDNASHQNYHPNRFSKQAQTAKVDKATKPKKKKHKVIGSLPDKKSSGQSSSDNLSDTSTSTTTTLVKVERQRKTGVGGMEGIQSKFEPLHGSLDITSAPKIATANKQNIGQLVPTTRLGSDKFEKINMDQRQTEMGDVFEPELLPDYAKSYILPKRMYRKPDYKEEEDVYRKQGQDTGRPKSKSAVAEELRKQSVANDDFQFSMLKASLDYDAELFGNQEIKSLEQAEEANEVMEQGVKPIPKVEKRRSKSMVPCTSPGKMFEYSKYTQDGGYVPEAVRNAQVGLRFS